MKKLVFLSASELAAQIQRGEISSRQVVEAFLTQIDMQNKNINALVTIDRDQALRRAQEADEALARGELWGPLHGVPVTFKDVFQTQGLRTTSGFPRLKNFIPQQDAVVVARMRKAGAIILAKSNTPEMANDEQTDNRIFGRTKNPWDLNRTPGGSSGGSAAAVAGGLTALGIGSDIGGSVRNPAAFCGVFSLKPTDSLVPFQGHVPPPPNIRGRGLVRQFLTPGPIARSVKDLRLALQILAGAHDAQWEVPPVQLVQPEIKPLKDLRIAWSDDFGLPVEEEIRAALSNLADALAQAGCQVEKANPPDFDFFQAIQCYGLLKEAAFSVKNPPLHLPRFFWKIFAAMVPGSNPILKGLTAGAGASLKDYAYAMSLRDGLIAKMELFLDQYDAWICPTAACTAYPHLDSQNLLKQISAHVSIDGVQRPYILATSAYTSVFNLCGNPVVVMPFTRSSQGLPIGFQLVGKRWQDMQLLNTAETITGISGEFTPPPGY